MLKLEHSIYCHLLFSVTKIPSTNSSTVFLHNQLQIRRHRSSASHPFRFESIQTKLTIDTIPSASEAAGSNSTVTVGEASAAPSLYPPAAIIPMSLAVETLCQVIGNLPRRSPEELASLWLGIREVSTVFRVEVEKFFTRQVLVNSRLLGKRGKSAPCVSLSKVFSIHACWLPTHSI